jgi:hypothetical protein
VKKIMLATTERMAEVERNYYPLIFALADAQDEVGATVFEVLNTVIDAFRFAMGKAGHEDIGKMVRDVFDERFEWPEMRKDEPIILPIVDAIWQTLDLPAWAALDDESREFGERAHTFITVLAWVIATGTGQIWGPDAKEFAKQTLMKAADLSLLKASDALNENQEVN